MFLFYLGFKLRTCDKCMQAFSLSIRRRKETDIC